MNTSEPWEVKHWTKEFGVTEQQLKDAVKAGGPMVTDQIAQGLPRAVEGQTYFSIPGILPIQIK